MIYKYSFSKKAILDTSSAVKWYEERSLTAAEGLISELEYIIAKLTTSPLRYRLVSKHIRVYNFRTFPYRIFYAVEEKEIIILRIRHYRQKPLKGYQ